jgi:hypothetical protein
MDVGLHELTPKLMGMPTAQPARQVIINYSLIGCCCHSAANTAVCWTLLAGSDKQLNSDLRQLVLRSYVLQEKVGSYALPLMLLQLLLLHACRKKQTLLAHL